MYGVQITGRNMLIGWQIDFLLGTRSSPRRGTPSRDGINQARVPRKRNSVERKPWSGACCRKEGRAAGRKRRGMSAAARKAVSARMKKYWAAKRKANASAKK
jgi:hypothetical protein